MNNTKDLHMSNMGKMVTMTMTFSTKLPFYLLLNSAKIRNDADLLAACLLMFVLAMLYEFIKAVRVNILDPKYCIFKCCTCLHQQARSPRISLSQLTQKDICRCKNNDAEQDASASFKFTKETAFTKKIKRASVRIHVVETILHGIQLLISYILMLAVMTYNVAILASVILGCITGYFISNWPGAKKQKKQFLRQQANVRLADCH